MFLSFFLLSTIFWFSSCRPVDEKSAQEQNDNPDVALEVAPEPDTVGCVGDEPAVSSSSGCIVGIQQDQFDLFLGVPYAKPPIGDLRWQRPQAVEPWAGPFIANTEGSYCVQRDYTTGLPVGAEDCLFLNIVRPSNQPPDTLLPILFYTHGGSFVSGAGAVDTMNNVPALAENAIVVTHNYRLGIFGFLAHERLSAEDANTYNDGGSSGNYGLFDTLLALEWVYENAEHFGGDSQQIMVFGESAGGAITCSLLASPLAADLFVSALIQSSACTGLSRPLTGNFWAAEEQGRELANELQCNGDEVLDCLRNKSIQELMNVAGQQDTAFSAESGFSPNIDGVFLPDAAGNLFYYGDFNRVNVAAGVTANEGSLFVHELGITDDEQLLPLYELWAPILFVSDIEGLLARYNSESHGSPQAAVDHLYGDAFFMCPTRLFLDLVAPHTATHAYYYSHEPSWLSSNAYMADWGAYHSSEIPYVFGVNLQYLTPEEQAMSAQIQALWTAFAQYENAPEELALWELYGVDTLSTIHGGKWLEINDQELEMRTGVNKDNCDFFYSQWFE